MTNLATGILETLIENRGQRFIKDELKDKYNTSEREVRRAVRELRLSGHPICSRSDMSGYWYGTEEQYERVMRESIHRALELLKIVHAWENKELDGQIEIERN